MSYEPETVAAALTDATDQLRASGSESPRLDAEVLLGSVLGVDRSALIAHSAAILGSGQRERYDSYLERRCAGEPVAYIRGIKEFYGAAITVDSRVLIPRPETETLVKLALERVRADLTSTPRSRQADPYLIWDIGTGSGAIPTAIAVELRRRRYESAVAYLVSDASADALEVALINAVSHGVANYMTFSQGDLIDIDVSLGRPTDLLLANLPYIPSSAMPDLPVAATFEPSDALDGGEDGLEIIRRLLPGLPDALSEEGSALLEIGSDQADAVTEAAAAALPGWVVSVHDDLGGQPRVVQLEQSRA